MDTSLLPLTVYGSSLSYFTGKLEMYLRLKGIDYRFEAMTARTVMPLVKRETGTTQMPAVKLADGRWLSDTTPMIAWFEQQQPDPPIIPLDPQQRFFCLLLEDYADEWLWRPAMHYRWYWDEGAMLQSRHLADELAVDVPAPDFLKRWLIRRRQRDGYTRGDGIDQDNRAQVEAIYLRNLDWLQSVLATRDYLLGNSPSLADVAFTGPFFRHFSQDPVAAEIMRQRAPAVWAWVARMWNCAPAQVSGDWLSGVPEDWGPCLDDIGQAYLPYLCQNIAAVRSGETRFSPTVDGITYQRARTSRYRIWCLEQLRDHFNALPADCQEPVQERLDRHACWEPMWRVENLNSGVNRHVTPPFGCSDKMLQVHS